VKLTVDTDYPWTGTVNMVLEQEQPGTLAVYLRIPEWCRQASLAVDQEVPISVHAEETGYVRLEREWGPRTKIQLTLEMPVCRIEAHPGISACKGKVSLQRGPLVYGFESIDNGGRALVEFDQEPVFEIQHRPELLGGITVIRTRSSRGEPLVAVPFYALANRQKAAQEVWVNQKAYRPESTWWLGRLYRPVQ
jgi:hypothetical protein